MNEQETRTEYIIPALQKAGWGIVPSSRIREEFPISKGRLIGHGQRSKPDKADFVLQYKNRNIAVIEAKEKRFTLYRRCRTGKRLCRQITDSFYIQH